MRHALILAGGSGTRLWPMSRAGLPKQLIPFVGGKSLLLIADERIAGIVPPERRWVCAGERHRAAVLGTLPDIGHDRYLGEPTGRDTLAALALSAAVIGRRDPDAAIAVFPSDHVIEPAGSFREIIVRGYEIAERSPEVIVTFGIAPGGPSTAYGYLQLGAYIDDDGARIVEVFREKPDRETARRYFEAGSDRFAWNSGMFVWRASTFLGRVRRYHPELAGTIERIAAAWDGPDRGKVLAELYPTLKATSVDFGVLEPASRDPEVRIVSLPMPLRWIDIGSWNAFAETCHCDSAGNKTAAGRAVLVGSTGTLVASSDPDHIIAAVGCEGLIIIHTPDATLVCRADQAEKIKEVHRLVGEKYGKNFL
jgi:mannose-1-phosphate guanylyltransferase